MRAIEAPNSACADNADENNVGCYEPSKGYCQQQRQGTEGQCAGRARDKRRKGRQRNGISLRIGDAEDQAATERAVDIDERLAVTLRLGGHGTPANPSEIEAAQQTEQIEDEGADGLGADDGDQSQRRPDEIAEQMATDEECTRLAALAGTYAEECQKGRTGNKHIEKRGEEGADNERLRHDE